MTNLRSFRSIRSYGNNTANLFTSATCFIFVFFILAQSSAVYANHGGLPTCQNGHVCLYKDHNYDGGIASYAGKDADYGNGWFPDNVWDVVNHGKIGSIDDEISSIKNRGNRCSTKHFFDKNYGGNKLFLKRGWNATLNRSNDEFSSHHWVC